MIRTLLYTVKDIRISTDILRRVFRILTEPVPYTFVSVNRRNNEAWVAIAMWARAPLFCRFIQIQTHTKPVPLKYEELAADYLRGCTEICFTV